MLVAMAGLPGAGKSSLARAIGHETAAVVLAVDAIEAAMWRAGLGGADQRLPTGLAAYAVAQTLAAELLAAGHSVVADAVNAVEPARAGWNQVATEHGVPIRWLEVTCSNPVVHRERLAARGTRYQGFTEPTWQQVETRRIEPWSHERLVLDSMRPLEELLETAMTYVSAGRTGRRPAGWAIRTTRGE
ncbi:AAA family ATPase [Pseudactinotalea suaedae]